MASMAEVGAGSMCSCSKTEHLPSMATGEGSVLVDIDHVENPDTLPASLESVARFCRKKNKELRVKVLSKDSKRFIPTLSEMGFTKIQHAESAYIILREDQSKTRLCASDLYKVVSGTTLMRRGSIACSSKPCNLNCSRTSYEMSLRGVIETMDEISLDCILIARKSPRIARKCLMISMEIHDAMKKLRGTLYPVKEKKTLEKADHDFLLTFETWWYATMESIKEMAPSYSSIIPWSIPAFTDLANFAGTEFEDSENEHRVKHWVVADLPSSANCHEELGDKPDSESEAVDIPTDEEEVLSGESGATLESYTEIVSADSHGPRPEPSRKRSAASAFDEDSLSAKIRPFVNQQIEEALLPLMSALRSREEDEHKHRQKMLALEKEKLALMRQKLECTRRSNAVPASVAK